jgi:hypothetical protein
MVHIISVFASQVEVLFKMLARRKLFIAVLYQGKIIRLSCLVGQSMARNISEGEGLSTEPYSKLPL